MARASRWLALTIVALAFLTASATSVQAQMVCYQPAPVMTAAPAVSYYTPAPAVSYYAAPAVSYYAPATAVSYYAPAPAVPYYAAYAAPAPVYASYYAAPAAVTTYRYGPFGRLRGVRTYYGY